MSKYADDEVLKHQEEICAFLEQLFGPPGPLEKRVLTSDNLEVLEKDAQALSLRIKKVMKKCRP